MEEYKQKPFRVVSTWSGPINAEPPPPLENGIRIVCVSDTHGFHKKFTNFPNGDVLIHAGDFTNYGTAKEILSYAEWMATLPHAHKVVVCGNHEYGMDTSPSIFSQRLDQGDFDSEDVSICDAKAKLQQSCTYLENSGTTILGLKIYGSPASVGMGAFGLPRGSSRAKGHWSSLPAADVLITHGPPAKYLGKDRFGRETGDADLLERVLQIRPILHCFGHIHEGYGVQEDEGICFVNAATTDKSSPIVVDIAAVV